MGLATDIEASRALVTPWIKAAAQSYQRLLNTPLWDGESGDVLAQAERAPFALLMHNGGKDPVFQYANARARDLFGYTLEEFRNLPSRLSAEPDKREERADMLRRAAHEGYFLGYEGVRITKDGQRFRIANAVIWQVQDAHGKLIGQAARIPEIEPL